MRRSPAVLLLSSVLLWPAVAGADVVLADPRGNHLVLREQGDTWIHWARDRDGRPLPDDPVARVLAGLGGKDVVVEIEARSGYEVGRYEILSGADELRGRRLTVRVAPPAASVAITSPSPQYTGVPSHLHSYGVPIVAVARGVGTGTGALTASAAIGQDGRELCVLHLDDGGFGVFRGRFLAGADPACGADLLARGGGSYSLAVAVKGAALACELVDRRQFVVPKETADGAFELHQEALPVRIRANVTAGTTIRPGGRYFASVRAQPYSVVEAGSERVDVELRRNGETLAAPAPVVRGSGVYDLEMRGEQTVVSGVYDLMFRLQGRLKGGAAFRSSSRALQFRVAYEEPTVSASVYFGFDAAVVAAAANAEQQVRLDDVLGAIKMASAGRPEGRPCALEIKGYASKD
ncbi:MAG: hypothetical protein HY744_00185, partial [Deltaproteobacteria bacterium]|nr:hypothetical protein [Deltaproteobacteria bacterium]